MPSDSDHRASNVRLIEKFLPVEFDWQPHEGGGGRVTVEG
jgi:RNA 3'-terminal phosphate cyclase (ATP)